MSNILGKCPACEKGDIKETESHYSCNYFKSADDKCGLTIWKNFYGIEITDDIVKELIENKKTRSLELVSKEGKPFNASIVINEHNTVGLSFDTVYLDDIECPHCGGKIVETSKSYICEGYFEQSCNVKVNKVIANVELSKEIVSDLLKGQKSDFIEGFTTKDGDTFDARLYLDDASYEIKFDSSITSCPKCKNGHLKEFPKAYSCSNYRSNEPCVFSVWKYQYGGVISRDHLIQLCTKNETKPITFKTKEGNHPYKGKLILSDSFVVSMEKVQKK